MLSRTGLRRLAALALVALVTMTAGCDRDGDGKGKSDASASEEPLRSDETKDRPYSTKASGDVSFDVEGTYPIRIFTIRTDSAEHEVLSLLSVGPNVAISLPDGRSLRVAFDLTRFKGNGTYQLRVGSPRDVVEATEDGGDPNALDASNVLVQVWPAGVDPKEPAEVYDVVVDEPCKVTVEEEGQVGRLQCKKVSNTSGKNFNLDMQWGERS